MEKKFYFPLTITVFEKKEWGVDWDYGEEKTGRFASLYQNEIEATFDEYTAGEDMAEYIHEDDSFKSKVRSMFWGFALRNGCLYGVVNVELSEPLSESETEDIKDYISGQNSDGLGESFEQKRIDLRDDVVFVSFWHSGDDYYIYTEEEFESLFSKEK